MGGEGGGGTGEGLVLVAGAPITAVTVARLALTLARRRLGKLRA